LRLPSRHPRSLAEEWLLSRGVVPNVGKSYVLSTTFAPNFNKVKTSTNTIWGVHARADAAVRRCRRGGHGGRELTRSRFTHWVAWMVRGAALAMATTLSW